MRISPTFMTYVSPLVGMILLLGALGCQSSPMSSIESAERARLAALESRAERYAFRTFQAADSILAGARLALKEQHDQWFLLRNYADAESLFTRAARAFHAAGSQAADSMAVLRNVVLDRLDSLKRETNRRRRTLDTQLVMLHAERQWSLAGLRLDIARDLLEAEEFEEAIHEISRSMSALDSLDHAVAEYRRDSDGMQATWNRWIAHTLEESRTNESYAIIVDKAAHETHLIKNGRVVKTYPCDLGHSPASEKMYAGDGRTPEGEYRISAINNGSKYYRALLLNYPNARDREQFRRNRGRGLVPHGRGIGGLIEIHGHGGQSRDWTDGCVALADADMDSLMTFVGEDVPVTIVRRWRIRKED
ncbi:L,D-transpeptidase [bacterium]|nr:L,D-transpeptidase [bacterium]